MLEPDAIPDLLAARRGQLITCSQVCEEAVLTSQASWYEICSLLLGILQPRTYSPLSFR